MTALLISVFVALILVVPFWRRHVFLRRQEFIRSAALPYGLFDKLRQRHPQLDQKDCQLVANGLRQFFLTYQRSSYKHVSMPSQVVDDLWHEFILHTRAYQAFCQQAFGRFFHHAPAARLGGNAKSNEGLRRCWWHACRDEKINPRSPTRLPLLFALDEKLKIADGFRYVADCETIRKSGLVHDGGSTTHCGSDFSSTGIDGSTDGMGDGDGDGGADGGSDGGGDGGCGGGCGGD